MPYGWVEDPVPLEWPGDLTFRYGEVVRVRGVEMLKGRTGVVVGYDYLGDDGAARYAVNISDESVSWVFEDSFLESTGLTETEQLPRRIRPVLGDETVIRLLDTHETRERGIAGEIALTEGLWWTSGADEPHGYTVRLPGRREVHSVPFGAFEVVEGNIAKPSSSGGSGSGA